MDLLATVVRDLFLVVGALSVLIGSIGVVRFPDFFSRIHAAGVTDSVGTGFIFAGLMIEAGLNIATIKLVIILILMLTTSPTSSHALAKAALHGGHMPLLTRKGTEPSN